MRHKLLTFFIAIFAFTAAHANPMNYVSHSISHIRRALLAPFDPYPHNFYFRPFNTIAIYGPACVQIVTDPSMPQRMVSSNQSYALLHPWVFGNTLYLSTHYPTKPIVITVNPCVPLNLVVIGNGSVTVNGNDNVNLHELTVNGPASVVVNGLHSCLLNIDDQGGCDVRLRGVAVLDRLFFNSNGNLSLHWIDSTYSHVTGFGCGQINLAGTVCRLDADMHQRVVLNAVSLRAKQGFIETNAYACANVWARNNLATWAKGCSSIYYYRDSHFVGAYSDPPAVSLSMDNLNDSTYSQYCSK